VFQVCTSGARAWDVLVIELKSPEEQLYNIAIAMFMEPCGYRCSLTKSIRMSSAYGSRSSVVASVSTEYMSQSK
jgi:hypothetical protein